MSVFTFLCYMNDSAPTEDGLSRIECVVREYPPQVTTLQLGAQIAAIIIESGGPSPETVVISGEKAVTILPCMLCIVFIDTVLDKTKEN